MGRVDRLGLGRTLLSKINRENYQRSHRKKLTLPVLKGFKPELRASQVLNHPNAGLSMASKFVGLLTGSSVGMQDEGKKEQK
jgi:hypothetical protein